MRKFIILLFILGLNGMAISKEIWTVGTITVEDKPVVYKFLNKLPLNVISKFPWLTVVSWKYDGNTNNGMPLKDVNKKMIALEDALELIKGENEIFKLAYTATGNNLKEFVFYISSRDAFMKNFNKALTGHSAYPIEINFYKDPEWTDLAKLLDGLKNGAKEKNIKN